MANYFYVPPMAGTRQQNLRQEDINQDITMGYNRRRRREDDHETAPMVLDDSDDAIQIVDEVKSKFQLGSSLKWKIFDLERKTGEKEDNVETNDDDDEDGLLLVDQVNGSFWSSRIETVHRYGGSTSAYGKSRYCSKRALRGLRVPKKWLFRLESDFFWDFWKLENFQKTKGGTLWSEMGQKFFSFL